MPNQPLPILRTRPGQYAAEDIPRPIPGEPPCVLCGWEPCKCEQRKNPEGVD